MLISVLLLCRTVSSGLARQSPALFVICGPRFVVNEILNGILFYGLFRIFLLVSQTLVSSEGTYNISSQGTTSAPMEPHHHPGNHISTQGATSAPREPHQHPGSHISTQGTTSAPREPHQHPGSHISTQGTTSAPR